MDGGAGVGSAGVRGWGGGGYKALYLPAGIVSLNHGRDVKHQTQRGRGEEVRPPDPRSHSSFGGSKTSRVPRLHHRKRRRRRKNKLLRPLWSASAAAKRLVWKCSCQRERKKERKKTLPS